MAKAAADFVSRMQSEEKALGSNLEKLSAFLETPAFSKLDAERRDLLVSQRTAMLSYHSILQQRISLETGEPVPAAPMEADDEVDTGRLAR